MTALTSMTSSTQGEMNVCIISKYPPLEGGIAAKTYWLARAYADAGLGVHVISNSNTAEEEYRIEGCYPHINEIPGVTLHEVEKTFPWHIPEEKHSLAKLVDKFLELHSQSRIDVIDTGYLVPYGIAGYLSSSLTGVPYVIRHGGSDIAKFLRQSHLSHLLQDTIKHARVVITDEVNENSFYVMNKQIETVPPYVPDPKHFFPPISRTTGPPRLTFFGKINWHWERKGLDLIVSTLDYLPCEWDLKIVGQGLGKERFLEKFPNRSLTLTPFVPPWEVPNVLRESDFVYCLVVNEPIPSFSNIMAEALSCGAKVVFLTTVPEPFGFSNKNANIIKLPDSEPAHMARFIQEVYMGRDSEASPKNATGDFQAYVAANIHALTRAVSQ